MSSPIYVLSDFLWLKERKTLIKIKETIKPNNVFVATIVSHKTGKKYEFGLVNSFVQFSEIEQIIYFTNINSPEEVKQIFNLKHKIWKRYFRIGDSDCPVDAVYICLQED